MNIVAGVDFDEVALKTFARNFPESTTVQKDVSKLTSPQLENMFPKISRPLLFAACAPCQPFSAQNRNKYDTDDRVVLLNKLHKFIRRMKPEYILLENVPGLQKLKAGPLTKFTSFLKKHSYEFDVEIKDAKNYGVPQSRRRLVLIASRVGKISLPKETHGSIEGLIPFLTVGETVDKYPPP